MDSEDYEYHKKVTNSTTVWDWLSCSIGNESVIIDRNSTSLMLFVEYEVQVKCKVKLYILFLYRWKNYEKIIPSYNLARNRS